MKPVTKSLEQTIALPLAFFKGQEITLSVHVPIPQLITIFFKRRIQLRGDAAWRRREGNMKPLDKN